MIISDQLKGLRTITPLSLKLPKLFSNLKTNYRRRTMSDAWMAHIGKRGFVFSTGRRARRRTVAGIGRRAKLQPEMDIARNIYDMGKDVVAESEDVLIAPSEPEKEEVQEFRGRIATPSDDMEEIEDGFVEPEGKVVFRSPNQRAIELVTTPIKVVRRLLTGKDLEPIKDFLVDLRDNTRIGKDVKSLRALMMVRLINGPNVFKNKTIDLVDEDILENPEDPEFTRARERIIASREKAFDRKLGGF